MIQLSRLPQIAQVGLNAEARETLNDRTMQRSRAINIVSMNSTSQA
jgi:hypothetical protein